MKTPSKNSNSEQTKPTNIDEGRTEDASVNPVLLETKDKTAPSNSNEEILKEVLTDEFIDEYYDLFKWGVDVKRVLKEIIRIALSKKDKEIKKLKKEISEKADYIYKLEFGIEEFNKENQKLNNKRGYWEKKFKKADEEIQKLKTEAKLGNIPYKEAIKLKEENQTYLSKLRELLKFSCDDDVNDEDWREKIYTLFPKLKEEKSP